MAQRAGPSAFYLFVDIFPLLLVPLLAFNVIALTHIAGSPAETEAWLASPLFTIGSFSGDTWDVSPGDLMIVLGLAFLFVEIIKSTRTDALSLINHGLAAAAFVVFLVEFLVLRGFTNSVFFILMTMQLIDVIAGYTITVVAAKRDFGSAGGIIGTS
jgi:hypothetical protein